MSYSSLDSKTIRPGSLASYSYYHSSIRQPAKASPYQGVKLTEYHKRLFRRVGFALAIILALLILPILKSYSPKSSAVSATSTSHSSGLTSAPAAANLTNPCQASSAAKAVIVSLSARHLWACGAKRVVYNTPVITGMTRYPETTTPTGTFSIYAKETNQTLTGSDSAGSWSDPVQYWMPFLSNQYGTFGLHDASWRSTGQFGTVSNSSSKASHGCVELPTGAAKWLYNWSAVGTTVTIKS